MRTCDRLAAPTQSVADSPGFCPQPSLEPLLAALGIFSIDEHERQRRDIRGSWLAEAPASIRVRFVLHGLGALNTSLAESLLHRDMVFLRGQARMQCAHGQLRKQFLWLQCATTAWPLATLIGKADDDAWVHLFDIEHALVRTLAELGAPGSNGTLYDIYWGTMESYHWHATMRRPVGFAGARFAFRRLPEGSSSGNGRLEYCLHRSEPTGVRESRQLPRAWLADPLTIAENGTIVGPFPFAKGPLYFLSSLLAASVTRSAWVRRELDYLIGGPISAGGTRHEKTWAWEDVFLGFALSMVANASMSGLVAIDAGMLGSFSSLYEPGLKIAPTTALWHPVTLGSQRIKAVGRVGLAHVWQRTHHCSLVPSALSCHPYRGCSGGQWRSCYTRFKPARQLEGKSNGCSTRLVDVLADERSGARREIQTATFANV